MQNKKISIFFAFLMGIFWPASSLLCVGKAKNAIVCAMLLLLSAFSLVFAPLNFIAITMYIFFAILFLIWIYGLLFSLIFTKKNKRQITVIEKTPYFACYFIMMFFTLVLLCNLPVNFYQLKHNFENVKQNDILIMQEKVPLNLHNFNDSIIFYNEDYKENFGVVKAVAGDVLEYNDQTLFRNGEKLANIANFPTQKLIVPENLLLIQHDKEISSDLPQKEQMQLAKKDIKTLSFLTIHRIKGKALFILYSSNPKNLGKRLIYTTIKNN